MHAAISACGSGKPLGPQHHQFVESLRKVPIERVETVQKQVNKPETRLEESVVEVPILERHERINEVSEVEYREVIRQVAKIEVQYIVNDAMKLKILYNRRYCWGELLYRKIIYMTKKTKKNTA